MGTAVRRGVPDKTFLYTDMWVSETSRKSGLRLKGMSREGLRSSGFGQMGVPSEAIQQQDDIPRSTTTRSMRAEALLRSYLQSQSKQVILVVP